MHTTYLAVPGKIKICYMLQKVLNYCIEIILHELPKFSNILVEKRTPFSIQLPLFPRFVVNADTFIENLTIFIINNYHL